MIVVVQSTYKILRTFTDFDMQCGILLNFVPRFAGESSVPSVWRSGTRSKSSGAFWIHRGLASKPAVTALEFWRADHNFGNSTHWGDPANLKPVSDRKHLSFEIRMRERGCMKRVSRTHAFERIWDSTPLGSFGRYHQIQIRSESGTHFWIM